VTLLTPNGFSFQAYCGDRNKRRIPRARTSDEIVLSIVPKLGPTRQAARDCFDRFLAAVDSFCGDMQLSAFPCEAPRRTQSLRRFNPFFEAMEHANEATIENQGVEPAHRVGTNIQSD